MMKSKKIINQTIPKPIDYEPLSEYISFRETFSKKTVSWNEVPFYAMVKYPIQTGLIVLFITLVIIAININYADAAMVFIFALTAYVLIQAEVLNSSIKLLRIERFAKTNKFTHGSYYPYHSKDGVMFDGYGQFEQSYTGWYQAMQFCLGNYSNSSNLAFGCLIIDLPHELPNMLLDSVKNNLFDKRSSLPTTLDKDQFLSLEGDFDTYFRLYCPAKYEQQALYIFTPDVMALLIDLGNKYDIEIVGKQLNIYSMNRLDLADRSTLRGLFRLFSAIGPRITKKSTAMNAHANNDASKNIESVVIKQPVLQRGLSAHPAYIFFLVVAIGLFVIWLRDIIKQ